ncbi:MAG TPA: 4-alpha-glucanotransferase, partial [bacterium]|nr:4-alpha-glucanotransferase [bacterium]
MKKIRLILGIHNHQPVGNFDFVLDKAYKNAYRPFLDMLRDFPGVRVGMHTSGILYEWLDKHYPEYSIQLRTLTDRGQIELIGGGFYEPILPIIPHRDQVGQIQRLQKYLLQRYEQAAQGMWLAERVWEPHLPSVLSQVGVRYVILDDTHFLHAGLSVDDLSGYYITEDQ